MRGVLLRSVAVLGVGLVILAGILYYASTVDGRPPVVERIGLTQHASGDDQLAVSTTSVEVEFSEPVQEATAESAFRIEPQVSGEYSWAGNVLTFTPTQRLPLETSFRAWVMAGVQDRAGNRMPSDSDAFEFTTVGAPAVTSTDPADGADDVQLDAHIVITFSTLMDTASVESALSVTPQLEMDVSWSEDQLTLMPSEQLREATRYTVTIGTEARDTTGTSLASSYRFSFTTTRSPLAPSLLFPADGADGIAVTTPVAIFFDREVAAASLTSGMLSIEPNVAGSLDVISPPGAAGMQDPTRRLVRFEPSAPLQSNTTYHVRLDLGAEGTDGSRLGEPIEWSFTTGAPLSTLSNQIVFLSDRAGVANLWAMNPDGSVQRQLSSELSPVTDYAVSPAGRRFIVGDGAVLVLQQANGSSRAVLTAPDALEYDPAWAPDGERFAFGRSERESGEGDGLWTRAADGGDDARVVMPAELAGGGTAEPVPSPGPLGNLLRAPRYSPDTGALAFVDVPRRRVGVLELPAGRLTTAPLAAVGPPVWLGDSTGVLIPRLDVGAPQPDPGRPLPTLNVPSLDLDATQLHALRIVRLDRGATRPSASGLPAGTFAPAVGHGTLLFVQVPADADLSGAQLWLSRDVIDAAADRRLLPDATHGVTWVGAGVEQRNAVAALDGDGIWVVDTVTGRGQQVSRDGWQPRWLP